MTLVQKIQKHADLKSILQEGIRHLKIAFDVEWNSKDQTFDRDLYAFRSFSECGMFGK